jgi:hypothetical protein
MVQVDRPFTVMFENESEVSPPESDAGVGDPHPL